MGYILARMCREARAKGLEEGIQEGMRQGMREGIRILIETYREWKLPEEEMISKVAEKYKITEEEVRAYIVEE